jgi:hypothetical protein
VVTSSISRPDPLAPSFGGAHRGRVCVHTFIGVSVYACMRVLAFVLCLSKKDQIRKWGSKFIRYVRFRPSPIPST